MSPLRKRMHDEMVLRGLAKETQRSYLNAVIGLSKHFQRSPEKLSNEDIRDYLVYLAAEKKLAYATVRLCANGLLFFYRKVLGRESLALAIPPSRKPKRLPQVHSQEEISRLLDSTTNPKHRILLILTYSAGLRVSETVALQVADIESGRMMIRIREGKGGRDRYVPLSPRLLEELRDYFRFYRPQTWLFPSRNLKNPIAVDTLQRIYHRVREAAGIPHRGGIHILRHSYATHLLEHGVDIFTIQHLLGHKYLQTTLRYLRMTKRKLESTPSPFDLLPPSAHGKENKIESALPLPKKKDRQES